MIPQERQRRMLKYLDEHETLAVEEAVRLLGASPATIRRDFNDLANQHLVVRTHGGVGSARLSTGDMVPFWCRQDQFSGEKSAIAKEAASRLRPNDIVMIDGGTTTFHAAQHLPSFPLRLITNSVRLAVAIDQRRDQGLAVEVYLTGGYIYPKTGMLIGPQAAATFSRYHADWAFLTVAGICADGVYHTNEFIVEAQLAMIERAERVIVVADHSKIGIRSMCRVCGLDRVHQLITDKHASTALALRQFAGAGLEVFAVDPGTPQKRNRADAGG